MFKATGEGEDHSILWGYKFKSPTVATFNVLRTQNNTFFILLQLRPRVLLKHKHTTSKDQLLPHLGSVYVRLVEDTKSLFAMSPDRFPLVAFSGGGRKNRVKVIDAAVDAITAEGKRRENAMKERNYGSEDDRSSLHIDRRCLVGMHPVEGGGLRIG